MNPLTRVSRLMSTDLITVMPSTPLAEALHLFEAHHVHHVPVVDADRTLRGILSQSDLIKLLGKTTAEMAGLHVRDLMTSRLAKIEATDNVATAANLFMLNRFHALPVVEGDKIIGILTTLDLIKLIDQEQVELDDYAENA